MIKKVGIFGIILMVMLVGLSTAVFAWDWDNDGNNPGANDFLGTTTNTDLRIKTYGQQRMVVKADGKIGIGTVSPQQILTLGSGSNFATELSPPTGLNGESTSGGSLTTGDYSYKVVALDGAGGESTWSIQHTQWVNNSLGEDAVELSWSPVPGAASYRIYGRAVDAQNQYWTPDPPTDTFYIDDGTDGTSGTPPDITTAYIIKLTAAGNSWMLGGNVGIGTASPSARLEVNPIVTDNTNYYGIKSGITYNGGSTMTNWYGAYIESPVGSGTITNKYALVTEADAGNVGIGTTGPLAPFDVKVGTTTTTTVTGGVLGVGATTVNVASTTSFPSTGTLIIDSEAMTYTGTTATTFTGVTRGRLGTAAAAHANGATVAFVAQILSKSATTTPHIIMTSAGNVGIGTASPTKTLDVNGDAKIKDWLYVAETSGTGITFMSNPKIRSAYNDMDIYLNTDNECLTQGSFDIYKCSGEYEERMVRFEFGAGDSFIIPADDFGIGINSPSAKLHVVQSKDDGETPVLTLEPVYRLS